MLSKGLTLFNVDRTVYIVLLKCVGVMKIYLTRARAAARARATVAAAAAARARTCAGGCGGGCGGWQRRHAGSS